MAEDYTVKVQREKCERIEALNKAAADVAAALGADWSASAPLGDENDTSRTLVKKTADGYHYGIYMHKQWHFEKWSFSGSYPKLPDGQGVEGGIKAYNETLPECGIARSKSAEQIAKDLGRRLLPAYEEKRNLAIERIKSNVAYNDGKAAIAKQVGDVLGVALHRPEGVREANYTAQASMFGAGYGEIEVYGDRTINLNLKSVPVALALELCKVLAKHRGEEQSE